MDVWLILSSDDFSLSTLLAIRYSSHERNEAEMLPLHGRLKTSYAGTGMAPQT